MRAIVVRRYGSPEVFELRDLPDPQLKPGQVLIRVKAAGINFADILSRMGLYGGVPKPPFVPGLEVAGIIEDIASSLPPQAANLQKGVRVAALTKFRGYAELVAVPALQVFPVPDSVSFEDAAAMPVNYLTAYHSMFQMGNLQAGDRILIHAAAGGVGIAAVQLAKARNLVIFGTAGPAKQDYLRSIGVHYPIDYSKEDFVEVVRRVAPDGIELAFDAVGGDYFKRSQRCLGPCGRLVVYGFSAAVGPDGKRSLWRIAKALLQTRLYHPLPMIDRNLAVIGVHLGRMMGREALMKKEMDEILGMYEAGEVKPVIGKSFPLEQAADAHRFIHARQNIGKVLLTVS
ncbi:MAG: zinc-binding dehydrogenase [Acidobacteria bacterium]|nr:zinc-binding dehydrogenase [Acidobacteriota bacterium]